MLVEHVHLLAHEAELSVEGQARNVWVDRMRSRMCFLMLFQT